MGKSTAAGLLSQMGVPVIDTDVIAHQLVEPGQPALDEIRARFGPEVIGGDGRLRRDLLAQRVFDNAASRQLLEAILHPQIREVWLAQAERWRQESRAVGVVVIPLLFETNASDEFDAVICVACSAATQLERLRPRGWSPEQIVQRSQAQWPIERKMTAADFVIWTEGSLEVLRQQIERVLRSISYAYQFGPAEITHLWERGSGDRDPG